MARKGGLPKGTLDTLIDETNDVEPAAQAAVVEERAGGGRKALHQAAGARREAEAAHDELPVRTKNRKARKAVPPYTTRASKRKAASSVKAVARPVVQWDTDPVSRYAASRGLPLIAGPGPALRLAVQFAIDVREVARKERTNVLAVVSKALAGYLNAYDRV